MIKETETDKKPIKPKTTFSIKHGLRIGTWNVHTLLGTSRLAQLCKSFSDYGLLLLGVSEVRWTNTGEFSAPNGLKFIFSGRPSGQKIEGGVVFVFFKQAEGALLEWKAHMDRIISAKFLTHVSKVTVIRPNLGFRARAEGRVLRQSHWSTPQCKHGRYCNIDFNAQLGDDNTGLESTMGRQGIGKITENGELFTGLLSEPRSRHRLHPYPSETNPQAHVGITRREADIASGHHLLLASIRLKIASFNPYLAKHGTHRQRN